MYSFKSQQWTQIQVVNFKERPVKRERDRLASGNCGCYQIFPQGQVAAEYMFKDGTNNFVRFRVNRVELVWMCVYL